MDNEKRKSLTAKTVLGIVIPLLVMIVTIVTVGTSFAWFSDASEMTISTITLETAQSYSVSFDFGDGDLWKNTKYAGQTAIASDGHIISIANADDSPANQSNRAFSFVTVISLDTLDKDVDFALSFDGASVYKNETVNANGSTTTNKIVYRDYENDVQNIQYAFTWFFKEHSAGTVSNYVEEGDKERYIAPIPNSKETWYTPYGKLTFDDDGYVATVNDKEQDANNLFSTSALPQKIENFNTENHENKLYDFYIVFAPEQLYWSQYFKGDLSYNADKDKYLDVYTIKNLYAENGVDEKLITGNYSNQMYYSIMDYQGTTFSFSAMISVIDFDETEGV